MLNFTSVADVAQLDQWLSEAQQLKAAPFQHQQLGQNKTLLQIYLNPSLRTRLSTEKAARNLGCDVMTYNAMDGWAWELEEGVVMDGNTAEHIREAAGVVSQYADIVALRSFPSLKDKIHDYSDPVLNTLIKYASVPVINLESAIRHPLQSLTDCLTIKEHQSKRRPKVVLSWAPHPKALPQAVANSFVEWMKQMPVDLVITNPEGYDLDASFTDGVKVTHHQAEAFAGADFIYAKNWSMVSDYGQIGEVSNNWMIDEAKMATTNDAYFMHCLPVRRNVVVSDGVLNSSKSLVIKQAENRVYAAQVVLKKLLENIL
jgi:N-succinyl-L-ornithine transcarbamylase